MNRFFQLLQKYLIFLKNGGVIYNYSRFIPREIFILTSLIMLSIHQLQGEQITFANNLENAPIGLVFDNKGNLYVSCYATGNIYIINTEGNTSLFATGLSYPSGIAFDDIGNLYAGCSNGIYQIDSTGTTTLFTTYGGDLFLGIAIDPQGNIYGVDASIGAIIKFSSNGTYIETIVSSLNSPTFLTFDTLGNLYVSLSGSNEVDKITPGGTLSTFATGFNIPYGLIFDSAGNLYVSNSGNQTISIVSSNGSIITPFVTSCLATPYGITLDTIGNLYIANNAINTISQVTPNITITATTPTVLGTPTSFVLNAVDNNGNPATTYTGTLYFTSSDPLAVLPPNTTLTNGTGTFNAIFNTLGPQTITATDTLFPITTGISNMIQVIAPEIIGLCPHLGPKKGGTKVKIYGNNLSLVTAIYFGSKKVHSFTIHSDQLIKMIAPHGHGSVDVTLIFRGGVAKNNRNIHFKYISDCKNYFLK